MIKKFGDWVNESFDNAHIKEIDEKISLLFDKLNDEIIKKMEDSFIQVKYEKYGRAVLSVEKYFNDNIFDWDGIHYIISEIELDSQKLYDKVEIRFKLSDEYNEDYDDDIFYDYDGEIDECLYFSLNKFYRLFFRKDTDKFEELLDNLMGFCN